ALHLPVQLPHLLGRFRRAARAGKGLRVAAPVGRADRQGHERGLCPPLRRRPASDPRDFAGDQAKPTGLLATAAAVPVGDQSSSSSSSEAWTGAALRRRNGTSCTCSSPLT